MGKGINDESFYPNFPSDYLMIGGVPLIDPKKGFGIRQARKAKGLTQKELADLLGCSHTTISKYEQGEIENMPRPRMRQLAEILEVSPAILFDLPEIKNESGISAELSSTKQELLDLVTDLSETEAAILLASLRSALEKL